MPKKSQKSAQKSKTVKATSGRYAKQRIAAEKVTSDLSAKAKSQPEQPVKPSRPLPAVWTLTMTAARLLRSHLKLLTGITLLYGLLNLVLVQALTIGTSVSSLESQLNHLGKFSSSLVVFVDFVGTVGNGSGDASTAYHLFLLLVGSMAVIWALRQIVAGSRITVRDAYYRGMYPLVPFVLVLCVVGLQLLPLLIGGTLYSAMITNGIAINFIEKLISAVIFGLLALTSFYMLSSSLFALYIVTLPDMTPLKALRSARELVRHRRWLTLRKVLFLPVLLFLVGAVIMLPVIVLLAPLATWLFFALTVFALPTVHAYMYTLYRELLNE